jgi:regulatory protein spx
MLKIYSRRKCSSSQLSLLWLRRYKISFQAHGLEEICREDLIQILSFTEKGMDSIVKHHNRLGASLDKKFLKLQHLSFNAGVDYLVKNHELLRTPLLLDGNKCLIGYNGEEMRQFLPRAYRRKKRLDSFVSDKKQATENL